MDKLEELKSKIEISVELKQTADEHLHYVEQELSNYVTDYVKNEQIPLLDRWQYWKDHFPDIEGYPDDEDDEKQIAEYEDLTGYESGGDGTMMEECVDMENFDGNEDVLTKNGEILIRFMFKCKFRYYENFSG